MLLDERHHVALIDVEAGAQHAFGLAAANRQVAVRGDLGDRLFERRVAVELGGLVFEVFGLGDADRAVSNVRLAGVLAHLRIFGDALGADVARAGEGRGHVGHFLLGD